jgi:hypothetical protein
MKYGDKIAAAVIVAALLVGGWLWSGCGASPEVRAAYALEEQRCEANEAAIVMGDGTLAEDQEALALERARCDAALARIREGN